jgi:hypothetical protein
LNAVVTLSAFKKFTIAFETATRGSYTSPIHNGFPSKGNREINFMPNPIAVGGIF